MSHPTLRRSTPVLFVEAIEPSLDFWRDRLGMSVTAEVEHGDRLGFVLLSAGNTRVMLQTRASLAGDMPQLVEKDAHTSVLLYIDVDDLDATAKKLEGIPLLVPRRTTFYGAHEIGVREPGGNVVLFSQHDR